VIRIRQLTKRYGDNAVLRGVDLRCGAGRVRGGAGRVGRRQVDLLRCVNRLAVADGGELVSTAWTPCTAPDTRKLRQRVAMIFQHHNVVPRLSVLKNVLTGRLGAVSTLASVMHFFSRRTSRWRTSAWRRVGLAHKAHERTDSLSGGQMQRVGIARALAQRPRLILADEPVASLDPKTSRKVLQYLHAASRELGITVLCNLHQVDYAREFGDRIVGLAGGKLVFDGRGDELRESHLNLIYSGLDQVKAQDETYAARQPSEMILEGALS
jgi:phosphonate transport system ATP-binding protein